MGRSLLRVRDHRNLLDALDRLYEPVLPEEFPNHLFGVLSQLLPGTLHSFDSVELATGRVESHVTPEAATVAPVAEFEAAVGAYAWQNPVVGQLAAHPHATIQLSDLVSHREFRETDFYRHCHLPLGIRHQVAAGVSRPGHAGAFVVNRGGPRDFTAREVELLSRLRPHVARAFSGLLRMSELRRELEQRATAAAADQAPGWLPPAGRLTGRESEVLHWLSTGKRNDEIAIILGISPRTVHKHVEHILAKLGVETRTAAATLARGV